MCVLKLNLAAVVFLGGHSHDAVEVQTPLEEKFSLAAEWAAGPAANPANGHAKRTRAGLPGRRIQQLPLWMILVPVTGVNSIHMW